MEQTADRENEREDLVEQVVLTVQASEALGVELEVEDSIEVREF